MSKSFSSLRFADKGINHIKERFFLINVNQFNFLNAF